MAAFSDKIWSWKQSSKPMNFETIIVTAISIVLLAKKIAATFLEKSWKAHVPFEPRKHPKSQ